MGHCGENCGKGGLARVGDMSARCRWICGTLALLLLLTACQSTVQPVGGTQPQQTAPTQTAASEEADAPDADTTQPAPQEESSDDAPEAEAKAEPEPSQATPEYALHLRFMSAVNGLFRPDAYLTRAECAQLLCNLTGCLQESIGQPDDTYVYCPYYDVDPESWYYQAVCAAAEFFPPNEWQFRPEEPITLAEFLDALQHALGLTAGRWSVGLRDAYRALLSGAPESDADGTQRPAERVLLTRAQTATLVCRALRREPDSDAIRGAGHALLLDVEESRADYCDIIEAVVAHEYHTENGGEVYSTQALATRGFDAGVHLLNGTGYIVGEDGNVLRGSGLLQYGNGTYLRFDESGCIWADGALHPYEGEAVFARINGKLAANQTINGCRFDQNGFYTCGDAALDALVKETIAACTTDEMTQTEKLRACFDYVREFKYLGRNAAYDNTVKTFSDAALLAFGEKILSTGKGDCYNFTAAFCLLARQLGFSATTVVGECAYYWNWNGIAHAWVEITLDGQTWVFDPQVENYNLRTGLSNAYYGAFQVRYETASAYYMKH